MAEDLALGLAGPGETLAEAPTPLPAPGAVISVRLETVTASVAAPTARSFQRAETIMDRIPDRILTCARRGDLAPQLVFGLLLADHPGARANQLAVLAARHGEAGVQAIAAQTDDLAELHPLLRLPLAQLAFPALRLHPGVRREELVGTVGALVWADGRTSVFEYALPRLLYRDLYEAAYHTSLWPVRRRTLPAARPAVLTLLAVLAEVDSRDAGRAEKAFRAGVALVRPGEAPPYIAVQQGVLALDAVWPDLDGLGPRDKERLIAAVATVIGDDGVMTVEEQELTRTVCGMLHCPLPPLADRPV